MHGTACRVKKTLGFSSHSNDTEHFSVYKIPQRPQVIIQTLSAHNRPPQVAKA